MSCLVNVLQSEMGQGMRVYGSTFLWFIPFVRSLMELNELNSICVGEVIHYLENNVDNNVLSGRTQTCDKVTEFFIRILVDLIKLHMNNGYMERLSYFTHIWVDMVMQCATLSEDFCNTRGVHSTSHFGRGTLTPAVGVGAMSQDCMKLIRSMLKEGGRTGTDPESAHFLDLINRHLRFFSSKGWNLSKSEYDNLKKCLLRLVKVITERPKVSNDVLPCAPPTPPSDPSENVTSYPNSTVTLPLQQVQTKDAEVGPCGPVGTTNFIKDEPLWNHGECQSFCDGHEEIIKVKKEPYNPMPISESRPMEGIRIVAPEKVQEIKSRLADNFSMKQTIVKRRLKTEDERGNCSGLKEIRHASSVSPQPSTSQSKIPDSARLSKSSNKLDNDDDEEPLDVRRHRLKRSKKSSEEDSDDARQISVQLSSTAKQIHASSINIILDHRVSSSDDKLLENRVTRDTLVDLDSKSPERDFDDLSESQVFEFETQVHMVSSWNEPHIDITDVSKKHKLQYDFKACSSHDAVEPMDTQPISDEDIERACHQVEVQICKEQRPQEPISSGMRVPLKPSSNEKSDFIKHSKSQTEKSVPTDKGKRWLCKKPPVIAALSQKIKKRSNDTISKDLVKPCSSTMMTSSSSRGTSASSVAPLRSTPAVVTTKKVRKRVEPELPAEFLGLKKKERKAFEFSQRSLVTLGELRSHGQNVHVDAQPKSKRIRQQKVVAKKGKKLLASQDLQYFRQSRNMLEKSTSATAVTAKSYQRPVPETLLKLKPETMEEPRDEEDDYSFLPCSQPDPDRRMDNKLGTTEVNTSLSNDSKNTVSDWDENNKSKEFSSLQNNKCGSMAEGKESRDENCHGDRYDDEWMSFTQNEPTDMELCSQMEQMEEQYDENLMITGLRMDNEAGKHLNTSEAETSVSLKPASCNTIQKSLPDASTTTTSNDPLFIKPSMLTECQKKAKPPTKIYTSCSRSASLAKEMGKVANPLPAGNVTKAKVVRPPPAMPPPAMLPPPPAMPPPAMPPPSIPKSTPQHEFSQPIPPRPILHTPNQVSKPSFNVTFAPKVPSYKTYSRPEMPVSVRTPTIDQSRKFDNSPMYDQSYLKQAILKWEYLMFENYKAFGTPQDLCPLALKEVPTTFSTYTEYFNALYPLLLINTFEEVSLMVHFALP